MLRKCQYCQTPLQSSSIASTLQLKTRLKEVQGHGHRPNEYRGWDPNTGSPGPKACAVLTTSYHFRTVWTFGIGWRTTECLYAGGVGVSGVQGHWPSGLGEAQCWEACNGQGQCQGAVQVNQRQHGRDALWLSHSSWLSFRPWGALEMGGAVCEGGCQEHPASTSPTRHDGNNRARAQLTTALPGKMQPLPAC